MGRVEDQTNGPLDAGDGTDPDRPLREPTPISRPEVDESAAEYFSRPEGVEGGQDPRRAVAAPHEEERHRAPDPDPALAAAFAPGPDAAPGIERHPGWQDEADAPEPSTPDPWRDPHAAVEIGRAHV